MFISSTPHSINSCFNDGYPAEHVLVHKMHEKYDITHEPKFQGLSVEKSPLLVYT